MQEQSLLLQLTGELPLFKIIDYLIDNKGLDFSKKDIAQGAGISKASLFNYWPEMEKYGIIKVTRIFGKTKLYTLDAKNPVVRKLLELESTLIRQALSTKRNQITEKEVLANTSKYKLRVIT